MDEKGLEASNELNNTNEFSQIKVRRTGIGVPFVRAVYIHRVKQLRGPNPEDALIMRARSWRE